MPFHWHNLGPLEAVGGAAQRKYELLVEQAHGASAGSPAHLARMAFENAWLDDPAAVKAACEAEEGPPTEPDPKEEQKLLAAPEPTILDLWVPTNGEKQ